MRLIAILTSITMAILFGLAPASAEKRVALVIGNGAYKNATQLPNPVNDARAIAGMLNNAGFDSVMLRENLGIREIRRAIGDFSDAAHDADMAVVYYSGHGIEVDGINYLIPIDAAIERDTDVAYEAYSLDSLLKSLEPVKRLRLVMLDACRDNPFVRSMKRSMGTRALSRGLAAIEPTSVNTLIGFAAKAGSYALDGSGGNSPYATALLSNIATPGLDLRIAFGRVRDDVMKSTNNKQEPFVYGSLGGSNLSIVDGPTSSINTTNPPSQPQPQRPSVDPATQAWAATKDTTSIAIMEDFIRQFGGTPYGSMARARLKELQTIAAKPPEKTIVPVTPQVLPRGVYGAIAYSLADRVYGYSRAVANRTVAEQAAIRECGKGDCETAVWFYNSCGALSVGDDGSWGGDYSDDIEKAKAKAQARCLKEGGKNCKVVFSQCSP